jgi:hypothetical protein
MVIEKGLSHPGNDVRYKGAAPRIQLEGMACAHPVMSICFVPLTRQAYKVDQPVDRGEAVNRAVRG